MKSLINLFKNNRQWADGITGRDPEFFAKLYTQQAPEHLWIGCADSRVPANEITGLLPGELFVHRNIANQVVHSDLNCLSVIQFAVDVLKVKHIIVVGHYNCGGVKAAMNRERHGLVDNWLHHVVDVCKKHAKQLEKITDETDRADRLCELNVAEQVMNVAETTVITDAWARGQDLTIHGWVYDLRDGLLRDTGAFGSSADEVAAGYSEAVAPGKKAFPLERSV
ncbi:carbonate dehydratase [Sulfuriroseicoccus oceanibius]|uniref:Carbonic anhydrase n=1 Tax=Sulfuriroseicoccus oceanibius TaxID=2707525 RepID=A0A6B3L9Q8_9BACT|nr:carbonate dehydratase [Sulfuriroseicoccus oceanibius]QQL46287.1 carbonate dehydratase [Sulfuriroseicoccus oceanibius]